MGNSYNGYNWKQREGILQALKHLEPNSALRAYMQSKGPCEICGDPAIQAIPFASVIPRIIRFPTFFVRQLPTSFATYAIRGFINDFLMKTASPPTGRFILRISEAAVTGVSSPHIRLRNAGHGRRKLKLKRQSR